MGACRSVRHLLIVPKIRSNCHAAVSCRTSSKPGLLNIIICKRTVACSPVCWRCHHCPVAQSPWKCAGNHIECTCAGKHAEFLEQLALRSLAGGNVEAAINRLGLCKDALLAEVSSSGYTSETELPAGQCHWHTGSHILHMDCLPLQRHACAENICVCMVAALRRSVTHLASS